jgi:hypothetical protein
MKILKVELLKTRRSLALLMMFACPFMVVLLGFLIQFERKTKMPWDIYWANGSAIWCYFMLPLYIALVTVLLNGFEHKNAAWRLMLTFPISIRELYISKLILGWIFVIGANVVLLLMLMLTIMVFSMMGHDVGEILPVKVLSDLTKASFTALPILILQHCLSWKFSSIVTPLSVGVISTMAITQLGQSKYWIYYPWSYVMMAVHGKDDAMQNKALLLAIFLAGILLVISTWWLGKKDTQFQS